MHQAAQQNQMSEGRRQVSAPRWACVGGRWSVGQARRLGLGLGLGGGQIRVWPAATGSEGNGTARDKSGVVVG